MILKDHALFKIRSEEIIRSEDVQDLLAHDIARELRKIGIECGKVKGRPFCTGTTCKIGGCRVSVAVLPVTKASDSTVWSSIFCSEFIPWWKGLFRRLPREEFHSEHPLIHLCQLVSAILKSDQRIDKVRWLTIEEWSRSLDELEAGPHQKK
jgi:CDGSH-type Zn-finger protein